MRNIRYFRENKSAIVFLFVPLLITWVLCSTDSATAQSARGTVTGIVKDPSGAIVPGADISIVEKSSGVITQATSTGAGVYRAPTFRRQVQDFSFACRFQDRDRAQRGRIGRPDRDGRFHTRGRPGLRAGHRFGGNTAAGELHL